MCKTTNPSTEFCVLFALGMESAGVAPICEERGPPCPLLARIVDSHRFLSPESDEWLVVYYSHETRPVRRFMLNTETALIHFSINFVQSSMKIRTVQLLTN